MLGQDELRVSPTSPASLEVSVAPGRAYIKGDAVARQGHYYAELAEAITLAVATPHPSLNRADLVVIEDRDSSPDGGSAAEDEQRIRVITGTPAAGPVPPDLPPSAAVLALVVVVAGATELAANAINDQRRPATFGGRATWGVEELGVVGFTGTSWSQYGSMGRVEMWVPAGTVFIPEYRLQARRSTAGSQDARSRVTVGMLGSGSDEVVQAASGSSGFLWSPTNPRRLYDTAAQNLIMRTTSPGVLRMTMEHSMSAAGADGEAQNRAMAIHTLWVPE